MATGQTGEIVPLWLDKPVSRLLEMRQGAFAGTPTSPQCQYCPVRPVCHSRVSEIPGGWQSGGLYAEKDDLSDPCKQIGNPDAQGYQAVPRNIEFQPANDGIPTIAEIRRKGA